MKLKRTLHIFLTSEISNFSFRKKIVVASEVGDEIVERMMLSDAAKHFIVQSQLQLAAKLVVFISSFTY